MAGARSADGSGASSETADENSGPGYEEARDELIEVVRRLEAGGTTLEESLALWERGEQLAEICERRLGSARERLEAAEAARQPTSET